MVAQAAASNCEAIKEEAPRERSVAACVFLFPNSRESGEPKMDKDRIKGAAEQVKGNIKEAAGKVVGDAKLEAEGKADKAEGKIRNAVGGAKDAVRDAVNKNR